jgi:hypothetical protein
LKWKSASTPWPPGIANAKASRSINFGATSGDVPARIAVMHDSGKLLPRDTAVKRAPTAQEQREILSRIRQGLDEKALGIGMGIAYVPLVSRAEIFTIFQLAASRKTPIYIHNGRPGGQD